MTSIVLAFVGVLVAICSGNVRLKLTGRFTQPSHTVLLSATCLQSVFKKQMYNLQTILFSFQSWK